MPPPGHRREQLIERRKHLGFTQESLAYALEVSTSSIAQWERGAGTPTPRHRRKMADLLEVGLRGLDQLLDPDTDPVALQRHVVPPEMQHLVSLEQGATEVRNFELALIPGILQARSYAERLFRSFYGGFDEDEIARRLELRLSRQSALTRSDDPLRYRAVIDESALLRTFGSPPAMVEQLELLVEMSTLPNVELRILTFESMAQGVAVSSFWLLVRAGEREPFMVCAEDASEVRYHELPVLVQQHDQLFRYAERSALSAERSRQHVHEAKKRYL